MKWTNFLKDTIYQMSHNEEQVIRIVLYSLQKLNQQLITFQKYQSQVISQVHSTKYLGNTKKNTDVPHLWHSCQRCITKKRVSLENNWPVVSKSHESQDYESQSEELFKTKGN